MDPTPPLAIVVPDEGAREDVVQISATLRWLGRLLCINTTMLVPICGYVLYKLLQVE